MMTSLDLLSDDLPAKFICAKHNNIQPHHHHQPRSIEIMPQIFRPQQQQQQLPGSPTRPAYIPLYVPTMGNFGEPKMFQSRDRSVSENSANSACSGGSGSGGSTPDDCNNFEGHSLIHPSRLVQGSGIGFGISIEKSPRLVMRRIYHLRHAIAVLILVLVLAVSLCATILATEVRDEFVTNEDSARSLEEGQRSLMDDESAFPALSARSEDYNSDYYEQDHDQQVGDSPGSGDAKIDEKNLPIIKLNDPPISNYSVIKPSDNVVIIRSAADFQNLDNKCDTVTVTLLKEDFDETLTSSDTDSGKNELVKNLEIMGPVTEAWLQNLLTTRFQTVENLTLDVHQLCSHEKKLFQNHGDRQSKKGNKRVKKRGPMVLKNVKSLKVQNNSQLCSISSWIFDWEMPNIQYLSVYDSDLTKDVYDPIHTFFERNKDTLTSITISRSYLCDDCVYTDVKFNALKQFVISEQLAEPKGKGGNSNN